MTTAIPPAAIIARMVRASMLETMNQEYIKAARANGLPERTVTLRYALRNALPPIVTISGLQVGFLLGGAVFTEYIFAWPGSVTPSTRGSWRGTSPWCRERCWSWRSGSSSSIWRSMSINLALDPRSRS